MSDGTPREPRVVRVLPDVAAIDKEFDYVVPPGVEVQVGDVVRIELHGRRVGGWIVGIDVEPEPQVALKPLAKVSGRGPSAELIELAAWAAHRWAGRRASFLKTASPPAVVRGTSQSGRVETSVVAGAPPAFVADALASSRAVLQLGPGADRYEVLRWAIERPAPGSAGGQTLVLCSSVAEARALGARLRRDRVPTAVVAHDGPGSAGAGEWAHAAGGAEVVVGARAAAWAPAPRLARAIVFDEHDEAYQQEQAPTWHARDVVVERARRAGAACVLVSPCPSLEALGWGDRFRADRAVERARWPRVDVVDQRELDPSLGPLFSPKLVELVRSGQTVACVLNRLGRARLLACCTCASLARCATCDAAVHLDDGPEGDELACGRCGTVRPVVCTECGGAGFKNLRLGVSRAREELEVLAGAPVVEVTATTPDEDLATGARIFLGTEAVLHRLARTDAVAFLDMDQELLALRFRAAEEALALIARAGRLVARGAARRGADDGDRRGTVLVQTRTPEHPALLAALHGDPDRLVRSEVPLRRALGLPPITAMALVSGEAAPAFIEALGQPLGLRVQGPVDGRWRVIAPDHGALSDALAAVERPTGRLRIEVDPLRA